jgi:hypothetical protein
MRAMTTYITSQVEYIGISGLLSVPMSMQWAGIVEKCAKSFRFSVPVVLRRTNLSRFLAAHDFTFRERRVNAPQLSEGQTDNFNGVCCSLDRSNWCSDILRYITLFRVNVPLSGFILFCIGLSQNLLGFWMKFL